MRSNPAALAAIRERSGLTQTDLANATGVSQGRISELESKPQNLRPATAKKLAEALQVPVVAITTSNIEAVAG